MISIDLIQQPMGNSSLSLLVHVSWNVAGVTFIFSHLGTPLKLSEKIGTAKLRSFRTVAEAAINVWGRDFFFLELQKKIG